MESQKGLTIMELLTATSISAILVGLAVPGFGFYLEKNRAVVAVDSIHRAYQHARLHAVQFSKKVHLCGTDNNSYQCKKRWSNTLVAFVDKNDDHQPDDDEIIQHYKLILSSGIIRSRFAFGKPYTILHPDGKASFTGSMVYCPNNEELKNHHRVTWNQIGRAYKGSDRNKDGYIDDTRGGNLRKACK